MQIFIEITGFNSQILVTPLPLFSEISYRILKENITILRGGDFVWIRKFWINKKIAFLKETHYEETPNPPRNLTAIGV